MIIQHSVFLRFFARLWLVLSGAWEGSVLGSALDRMGLAVQRWLRGSGLFRFLWRPGALVRGWPESRVCLLFVAILNLPCALARWIYRVGKGVWDGSAVFRLVSSMGGATYVFLGLLMLVMLVAPHDYWNNLYGLIGAAAVCALFAVGSANHSHMRVEGERVGPYLVFFLLCVGGALVNSLSTSLSMRFFAFHLTSFLLVLLVVSAVRSVDDLRVVVGLAVAGLAVAALYGCYQGYVGVEIVASQQDLELNYGMPGRIYSFFDNPNNFAELIVMLLPLDLALLLGAKGWRGRFWSLVALALGAAAIGLTYSRSGWIGLALAVVVFLALENWRLVPVMVLLGLCAIPFLPETIYNRILTIGNLKDSSTAYRFYIFDDTFTLLKDYWYRGVGLGSDVMRRVFMGYPSMPDGSFPIHTHNNYLQMWGETGIVGLLSYLGVIFYGLKTGVKAFYHNTDRQVRHLLAAAIGAFCGILVVSLAEYTWFYPRNMFTYWFLFGVILACVKLSRSGQKGNA